jgi:hypothetical protein
MDPSKVKTSILTHDILKAYGDKLLNNQKTGERERYYNKTEFSELNHLHQILSAISRFIDWKVANTLELLKQNPPTEGPVSQEEC